MTDRTNDPTGPAPVTRAERDAFSDQALNEHAERIHQAREDGVVAFAQALVDSFTAADEARAAEEERRRTEWEASPEYARLQERKRRTRSEGARRGWDTRRERKADRDRDRPLGGFGAVGANTPVAVDDVCDESLLRGDDRCPGTILNLCGGCADGPTNEQVDRALAADTPDASQETRVRGWLTAAYDRPTARMVEAAVRAGDRYDRALDRLWGRPGVEADDTGQHQRRVGAVLAAAHRAKDLPPLPDLGDGPRVHAYTPAADTGRARHLLGNITPRRYEQLTGAGGTLNRQDPAAPVAAVPRAARRLLAAVHEAGLPWDLNITTTDEAVRLTVYGLGGGGQDAWMWLGGRLSRLHTTGRPLRDALNALATH